LKKGVLLAQFIRTAWQRGFKKNPVKKLRRNFVLDSGAKIGTLPNFS
jgi:hypothetical protein